MPLGGDSVAGGAQLREEAFWQRTRVPRGERAHREAGACVSPGRGKGGLLREREPRELRSAGRAFPRRGVVEQHAVHEHGARAGVRGPVVTHPVPDQVAERGHGDQQQKR